MLLRAKLSKLPQYGGDDRLARQDRDAIQYTRHRMLGMRCKLCRVSDIESSPFPLNGRQHEMQSRLHFLVRVNVIFNLDIMAWPSMQSAWPSTWRLAVQGVTIWALMVETKRHSGWSHCSSSSGTPRQLHQTDTIQFLDFKDLELPQAVVSPSLLLSNILSSLTNTT